MEYCNCSSLSLVLSASHLPKILQQEKFRPNDDIIVSLELHTPVDLTQDRSLELYIVWDKVP